MHYQLLRWANKCPFQDEKSWMLWSETKPNKRLRLGMSSRECKHVSKLKWKCMKSKGCIPKTPKLNFHFGNWKFIPRNCVHENFITL